MKLATWNVNGMKARLEFMKLWLEDRSPDVVGLQELKLTDETFPHEFFADLGYQALTHGQKSWNGVAVLSKLPMVVEQVGLPDQSDFGARLITVRIDDGSADGLQFTTVYCPNGKTLEHDDYPAKLAWFDSLAGHLAENLAPASVLCGDFNIVPEALDSWMGADGEGRLFHTDAERSRMERIIGLGLTDLYRALTGISLSQEKLLQAGERIWNLERLYNLREGVGADLPAPRLFQENLDDGQRGGEAISRDRFLTARGMYYSARGWDKDGIPAAKKIEELGLAEFA